MTATSDTDDDDDDDDESKTPDHHLLFATRLLQKKKNNKTKRTYIGVLLCRQITLELYTFFEFYRGKKSKRLFNP